MFFSFGNQNYVFCRNSMEAEIAKESYRNNFKGDYFAKLNFTTIEKFILDESTLYWSLVEDEIQPNIISKNAAICILEKIIRDKKDFDGCFQAVNSNSFFLAIQIYSIMLKSAQNKIPVDAIAKRIYKFKRASYSEKISLDMDTVIKSYRKILKKSNLYDMSMLIEKYLEKIATHKIYNDNMKNKKLYIYNSDDKFEFRDDLKEISSIEEVYKIFNDTNINKIIEDDLIYKENKNTEIFEEEFENYFDMLFYLENIISDEKYRDLDICIIIPKLNTTIESKIKEISSKVDKDIRFLSKNYSLRNSKTAIAALFALAIKTDSQYIFNEDEKVEFVKLILDTIYKEKNRFFLREDLYEDSDEDMYENIDLENDSKDYISELEEINNQIFEESKNNIITIDEKESLVKYDLDYIESKKIYNLKESEINYISIRKNLNLYIKEISDVEGLLPKLLDKNYTGFIKSFYQVYGDLEEESMKQISQIARLIEELSVFSEKTSDLNFHLGDDNMIKFIKDYLSNYTSTRRKIENKELGNVLLVSYREYLDFSLDSDIEIILDAQSPVFDARVESEIDTDLAYMDDSILSNIDADNIGEFYRDYQEKKIIDSIYRLMKNNSDKDRKLYILSSYKNIAGYDQENRFSSILNNKIQKNK